MKRENSNYRYSGQPIKAWVQRIKLLLTFIVFTLIGVKELSYAQAQFIFPRDGIAGWREVHTRGTAGDWLTTAQGLVGTIPNDTGYSFFFPPATLPRQILSITSTFSFIQSVDYNGAGVGIINSDATNTAQTNLRCELSEREDWVVLSGWLNASEGGFPSGTSKRLGRDIKLNTPYKLTLEVEGTSCRCILDGEKVVETIIPDLASFPSQVHPTLFIIEARARFADLAATTLGAAPVTTTAPPPTGCVQPPSGMVSWWPGDGNANDIQDGNQGTLKNGATFASGKVGQAFSFDGVDDFVSVPDAASLTLGANPFTIDLWVKFNQLKGRDPFIGHDEGGGLLNKWIFWFDSSGHQIPGPALRFHIAGPGIDAIDPIIAPWTPNIGQRYHVAVTRDGTTYALYIDGVRVATTTNSIAIPDPAAPLTIGRAEDFFLNGLIDEVEIYKRALSASEIQAIFAAGSVGKCKAVAPPTTTTVSPPPGCVQPPSGMVSWWPGDGNANDIQDNNHGTLKNGATFAAGKVGQALSFDGIDDFSQVSDSPSFDITSWTIDAWIKTPNAGSGFRRILSQQVGISERSPGTAFWVVGLENNRLSACSQTIDGILDTPNDGTSAFPGCITVPSLLFNDGQFHYVAVTRQAGVAVKYYIDGSLVKTVPITNVGGFAIPADVFIGKADSVFGPNIQNLGGIIDEVEIYNRALTASEIQAIFAAGSAGKCKAVAPLPTTTVPPPTTTTIPPPTTTTTIGVSENPQLKFSVNNQTLSPGQRFTLELNTFRGTKDVEVDLYVALMLPDGNILFFTGSFLELFTPRLVPFQQGIRVTDRKFEILDVTIPPQLAGFGNITFLAAYIRAGRPADLFNIVGNIEQIVITIR